MRRPDSLPPGLFPLSVVMMPSRLARYGRGSVGGLLGLLALWLAQRQVLDLGLSEPFLYLVLLVGVLGSAKPTPAPERVDIDAAGNFFVTVAGQRWRLTPKSIDACYAGWIHIRGRAWSDAPLDALKPEAAPQKIALTIWRDAMSVRDWQRMHAAVVWLEQRQEPLLGALSARNTKA